MRTTAESRAVAVDDVLITAELNRRPARAPDFEAESRALVALATVMAESPRCVFQKLADSALELCRAGSAGISVWEPDGSESVFRWRATAGEYTPYLGGTLPRHFSPCGTVLERGCPLLMADPVRAFPYIADLCSPAREVLLVPFHQGGVAVGTVWVVAHTPGHHFDAEDARLVTSLTRFAGAAVRVIDRVEAAEAAERSLRAGEERLRRMANVEGVGVLVWSLPQGRMIGSNDYFLRMVGYSRAEVEAGTLTWRDLTPPEYVELSEAQMAGFAETGRIGPYEKEYLRKDGTRAWMVFAGAALGDGEVVEYCIDVSDRKRAEAALRDADRKKDEFIALLAHELRNPLAPISNGLQVLTASGRPEARDRAVAMIGRQLGQMVRLVDDLMDVSRITRGKLELKRERVPLADVLASAVETSRPLIDQMGHQLTYTPPAHDVVVDADLTRLAQVFLNLLNNAAKYMDRSGHIWLTVERQGSEAVVSVRDAGVGIAADQLPHIFDLFSQVDQSLEKAQGGLGIGLTLVRRLTEMHGGTIEARSEGRGKGSEFVVRLPVVEALEQVPVRPAERSASTARRILIVDDNRDGADSLGEMMAIFGNDTRTAYDGEAAVAVAAKFRPEVILLDIGLPKLNGYDACRRIRGQTTGTRPLIIAQTGWGADEDRKRTREAGFDHHLVKPVDPSALMKLLAEFAVPR